MEKSEKEKIMYLKKYNGLKSSFSIFLMGSSKYDLFTWDFYISCKIYDSFLFLTQHFSHPIQPPCTPKPSALHINLIQRTRMHARIINWKRNIAWNIQYANISFLSHIYLRFRRHWTGSSPRASAGCGYLFIF